MASMLDIFQYTKKDTPVHRLDPRSKMVLSISFSAISLMFLNILPLLILIVVLLPIIATARSLRRWGRSMRGLMVLVLFIVVFNTLLSAVENPFSRSLALAIRLVALMTSFSVFFLTVHPDELSQALIQMHIKFEFAFAMSMAMRYVPTLTQEAYAIMDAQRARGVELDKGNIITRIKNIIPIIVPLIIVSIRRALSIAESMESRAFGASENRTYLEHLAFDAQDWVVSVVSLFLLVIALYFRFLAGLPEWLLWGFPF